MKNIIYWVAAIFAILAIYLAFQWIHNDNVRKQCWKDAGQYNLTRSDQTELQAEEEFYLQCVHAKGLAN